MAEDARNRRRARGWWLSLLAIAALLLVDVFVYSHGHRHHPSAGSSAVARPPIMLPGRTDGGGPSTGSQPKTPAVPGSRATRRTVVMASRKVGTRNRRASGATAQSPAIAPVACHRNLPLSRSPNAPYDFLCTQAGRPVTWSTGNIDLYVGPLSTVQQLALPGALQQWETEGHFTVTQVSSPATANVTMTAASLSNQEAGYTQVHYSCTSKGCFYDHARVTLSSTETLVQTAWVSTICHELGHAAGLDHVSRHPQVMYPYVNDTSPDAYTPGDMQGLQAEYQQRSQSAKATRADVVFGAWVAIS